MIFLNINPPSRLPSKTPQPAPKPEIKSPFAGVGPNKPAFKNILKSTEGWKAAAQSQLGGLGRDERAKLFDKYMSSSMGSYISESDLKRIDKKIGGELRKVPPTSDEHRKLRQARDFLGRIRKIK